MHEVKGNTRGLKSTCLHDLGRYLHCLTQGDRKLPTKTSLCLVSTDNASCHEQMAPELQFNGLHLAHAGKRLPLAWVNVVLEHRPPAERPKRTRPGYQHWALCRAPVKQALSHTAEHYGCRQSTRNNKTLSHAVEHADAGRAHGAGHQHAVRILPQLALGQPELAATAAPPRVAAAVGAGYGRAQQACGWRWRARGRSDPAGEAVRAACVGAPLQVLEVHLVHVEVIMKGSSGQYLETT